MVVAVLLMGGGDGDDGGSGGVDKLSSDPKPIDFTPRKRIRCEEYFARRHQRFALQALPECPTALKTSSDSEGKKHMDGRLASIYN
jgi:hypothetical protein